MKILAKNLNFLKVFLEKKTLMLLELTELNQHFIKLQKNKQPCYRQIYNLEPIKLQILKTYIKINLANSFIWLSKLLTNAFIFFVQKSNSNF